MQQKGCRIIKQGFFKSSSESNVSSLVSEEAIQSVIDHFGSWMRVVVNAGAGHLAPIDKLTEQERADTIDTNLTGVFNTVKASTDSLKDEGYMLRRLQAWRHHLFENGAAYTNSACWFYQAVMLDLRKYGIKLLPSCQARLLEF